MTFRGPAARLYSLRWKASKRHTRHARTTRCRRPAFRVDDLTPEAVFSIVIVANYSLAGLASLACELSPQQPATDLASKGLQQSTNVVRESQQSSSGIHAEQTEAMREEDLCLKFGNRSQRDVQEPDELPGGVTLMPLGNVAHHRPRRLS
jgi:hypothetical protein